MILLDTDALSTSLREPLGPVARRVQRVHPAHCYTTAITVGEMLYGLERQPGRWQWLREFIEGGHLNVLAFDLGAARYYARLRALLERNGQGLDEPDLRIAATALAHDLTLITGNIRHFQRVPGLRMENWLE